jgi:hypothetical protein
MALLLAMLPLARSAEVPTAGLAAAVQSMRPQPDERIAIVTPNRSAEKRANEILALGYVAARIMECVFILVGIIAVLAVVTLRHDAGADAAALGGYAESLAAIKSRTVWS